MIDASQSDSTYRFDWGLDGLRALAPHADVVIVVDVLRFTSAVSAALESGATVYPYPWAPNSTAARDFAAAHDAVLAGERKARGPSLSPTDLLAGCPARLVLRSPNGATLAYAARQSGASRVFAGCLRNATATATYIRSRITAPSVAVIAAGERWGGAAGLLRPAVEDMLGAGAIGGQRCSPEARAARAAFLDTGALLFEALTASASGRELVARGWEDDVATSAALDVTTVVAELVGDAFVRAR